MSISKKSLISNRSASKKAIVTKPEVISAEPTRMKPPSPKIQTTLSRMKPPSPRIQTTLSRMKPPSPRIQTTLSRMKPPSPKVTM